jgi:carbon-monoxide dehydrogenase medium subunit
VKPAPFDYHAPETVEEVIALLTEHGDDAKILAGGQSLVPLLALRLAAPTHLVDIGRVTALQGIGPRGEIRAGVTQRQAEQSTLLRARSPLLAEALPHIAHVQIRNRGTVCGSLAHADPAAELPAVMLALDAVMCVRGPRGMRQVVARDFFESYLETTIGPDELLTQVTVPLWPPDAGWSFQEISRRQGDFALVGCATLLRLDARGAIADARLAFTGVAPTPVRISEAELLLCGAEPGDELFAEVASVVSDALDPTSDVHADAAYRKHVAGVLTRRTLAAATERARAE